MGWESLWGEGRAGGALWMNVGHTGTQDHGPAGPEVFSVYTTSLQSPLSQQTPSVLTAQAQLGAAPL